MKLLASLTSPYARKVRVVMAEKKLDYELILEDVWADDSDILKHNPLGKVPCLIMDDQASLFDSRVIVEYLDTLSPVGRLIPQAGRDRAAVKCWEAIADGLLDACVAIVVEKRRPEEMRLPAWIDRQNSKITAALQSMNNTLSDQSFCMGTSFSLADIAVGCALGYLDLRFPELDWRSQYGNLQRLDEKLQARPSFASTLPPTQ
ncbi:glutathione S-transferase family protein [Alcaligenes faecalis]|jgi:glutathione S-transferase|uniref:glutathione S-transferase family protein n=1 Tax=Alcaligenes faecalis TaxID=511 RepID=UPI000F66448A|nr:glutathione S-transferase N-terminal domain-containing protein [Alcaligenes faecalis]MBW4787985.1 glutathione S-transferase N-terminal domain-containing protein [Alcaligenes faecalis subsp. faecalis]MBY6308924.1 glutathione S-transferase [Alcaligenes faecalis]MBY6316735.1 glutathione S-transferase [Alcaligenes faecalis]MBY6390058.1 glutathione S-transferase [Alcaligenes faecalis]QHS36974.1 glutathione S-transferase [Alcaligenes faecalis]